MRKKCLWLGGICAALSLMTGCWDRKEVLDVAILLASSLDTGAKPGTYCSHMHIVDPKRLFSPGQPVQSARKPIEHIAYEGKNLDDNRVGSEQMLPRDMVTSHRRVFVLGDELARRGIKDALDQLSRNPKNRLNTYLVVAEDSRGDQMLDLPWTMETFGAQVFKEIIDRKADIPTSLKDYFIASTTPGQQPIMASFNRTKENKITVSGIAAFNDHKLAGFVKGQEAALLTGLLGHKFIASFTVPIPIAGESVSVQLDRLKVKKKVDLSADKPKITITVKGFGRIMDNRTNLDLSNPKTVLTVNQAFAKELEKSFVSLFKRLQQELKTDSAGLGAMIYRESPRYWRRIEKDWPELYPKQEITWNVQGQVTGVGTVGAPLYLPGDEVQK